ncbi:helix-turn-helix transcriptional regulator [Rummeliibacillus suwonensis]|uniref:helix-turn-helix transcriptional regulator n=1 Tax=Rummeliibacillus suwonensis TaxID=1306154 RepID=UPI0011B41CAF|nr:helix-turn-helix transcriptional regulator [Rummeliibacillus suwonensis]
MKKKNFQQTVGFSVKDTIALYWLYATQDSEKYSVEIHQHFQEEFPGRKVGYEYVARVAKQLEAEGALQARQIHKRILYTCTDLGRNRLRRYNELYYERFHEIVLVLDRFYYELTKNGEKPPKPEHPLPEEFRSYFSKLISVKDAVRYLALKLAQTRSSFYMAEVGQQLEDLFGWCPSNGYLYQIAWELEDEGYLVGSWPDEKRTVRNLRGTDEGVTFYRTIAASLEERMTAIRHYLRYMLKFFTQIHVNQ